MIERVPYPIANTGVDWLFSPGTLTYWKSAFFTDLTDAAASVLIECVEHCPSPMTACVIEAIGGEEDLKGAVVYLASDRARYITGSEFVIDAGLLSR